MSLCESGGMPCGGKPGTVPLGRCWRPCGTCRPWPGDWPVQIPGTADRPALPLRLVACARRPAPPSARGHARQDARKHGHTPTAATLEAADYVLVLTSLPGTAADAAEILALYRLRWQIECAFKRLKRLLHLDAWRAFDPDLAQTYLLAKPPGQVAGGRDGGGTGGAGPRFFPLWVPGPSGHPTPFGGLPH